MGENTATIEKMISKLLEEKKFATLRDVMNTMAPADIAIIFDSLPAEKMPVRYLRFA